MPGELHAWLCHAFLVFIGPFFGAIAVPSVVVVFVVVVVVDIAPRLRYSYSWRATVATPGEWAQHFSNASCLKYDVQIWI